MAKPPRTPPSSDLDGVDQDRQRLDEAGKDGAGQNEHLHQEEDESVARPRPSRS